MTHDAILLRRYAEEKSEAAFSEFVQRHLPLVYGAAVRRLDGDAHRAKDITQIVFCAAAREAPQLARHAVLTGWLYTTTRNAVVDALRSESRRRVREKEAHAIQVVSIDPAAGVDWSRLRDVLDAVMDELGDDDREAVLLKFFQNRTYAEMGAAVGATEEASRKRVDRALDQLRHLLERRGLGSTAAALSAVLAGQAAASVPAGLAAGVTTAALAGGSAALGAATLLGLTKLQAAVAAVALTVGAVGLTRQLTDQAAWRENLVRQQQQVAKLTEENAALTASRAAAVADAEPLRAELAAVKASLVADPAGASAATSAGGRSTGAAKSADAALGSAATVGGDPTRKSVEVPADRLAAWHRRYDPFLQERKFTPAQVERIMQLWFLQEQARLDLQAAVAGQGLRGDAPGVDKLRGQLYAPLTRELREIMGEEGYAAYSVYEGTSYFRTIVTDSVGAS